MKKSITKIINNDKHYYAYKTCAVEIEFYLDDCTFKSYAVEI